MVLSNNCNYAIYVYGPCLSYRDTTSRRQVVQTACLRLVFGTQYSQKTTYVSQIKTYCLAKYEIGENISLCTPLACYRYLRTRFPNTYNIKLDFGPIPTTSTLDVKTCIAYTGNALDFYSKCFAKNSCNSFY